MPFHSLGFLLLTGTLPIQREQKWANFPEKHTFYKRHPLNNSVFQMKSKTEVRETASGHEEMENVSTVE